MKKEVGKENRTATDIEVSQGGYIPITAYIEKYGEEVSDAKLGALVRKNYECYQNSIAENKEKWKEEGEQFKEACESLNITQRELAECIGVHPLTVGKYEKGFAIAKPLFFCDLFFPAINKILAIRTIANNPTFKGGKR